MLFLLQSLMITMVSAYFTPFNNNKVIGSNARTSTPYIGQCTALSGDGLTLSMGGFVDGTINRGSKCGSLQEVVLILSIPFNNKDYHCIH